MPTHFLAPYPVFGRANNRLPVGYQHRSPYYWWWAYLKRSSAYLACCESGGTGPLATLYADFGDVRSDDFRVWWSEGNRGARLFGEVPLTAKFQELASPADWAPSWTRDEVLILSVPLAARKRWLKGQFARLLDSLGERHKGPKRGRPSASKQLSTARYPLARHYSIQHLQTALAIYDDWLANQQLPAKDRQTLWEIGSKHGLNRLAARKAVSNLADERLMGRNQLAATVGRYKKQALDLIAGTERGIFPAS